MNHTITVLALTIVACAGSTPPPSRVQDMRSQLARAAQVAADAFGTADALCRFKVDQLSSPCARLPYAAEKTGNALEVAKLVIDGYARGVVSYNQARRAVDTAREASESFVEAAGRVVDLLESGDQGDADAGMD